MRFLLLIIAALAFLRPASFAQDVPGLETQDPPPRFLGILELPPMCDRGCPDADKPVSLFDTPGGSAAPALVLSRDMLWIDPKHRNRDSSYWPVTGDFAARRSGAVVYARQGDWYRIQIGTRALWVSATHAGTFHPYPQLLEGQLTYLPDWNFILWAAPGKEPAPIDHPFKDDPDRKSRIPVRVLDFKQVDGLWWVHVEVLQFSPCITSMRNFLAQGWVPAYTPSGLYAVWFDAGGCNPSH